MCCRSPRSLSLFFLFIKEVRDSLIFSTFSFIIFLDNCIFLAFHFLDTKWLTCQLCLDLSSAAEAFHAGKCRSSIFWGGKKQNLYLAALSMTRRCLVTSNWSLCIQLKANHCDKLWCIGGLEIWKTGLWMMTPLQFSIRSYMNNVNSWDVFCSSKCRRLLPFWKQDI